MTFSRRPGTRFNRGRIATNIGAGAAPAATWLSILGSLAWWVRPDMGYTMGTGVAAWADQSGNGVNFLQGVGASQPTLVAADLDGYSAVRGDGANDFLAAAWARVAPGTQPFYFRAIYKQVSWTSGDCLVGDLSGVGFVHQQAVGATPTVTQFNGAQTNLNTAAVIGTYVRAESLFNNSVGSYHKIGASAVTGGNPGNSAGGGTMALFAIGAAGTSNANIALVEAAIYLGTPNAAARAALDALDATKYPSAVF